MNGGSLPALQTFVQVLNDCIAGHKAKLPGYTLEQVNLRLPDGTAVTFFWDSTTRDWRITTSG